MKRRQGIAASPCRWRVIVVDASVTANMLIYADERGLVNGLWEAPLRQY